MARRIIGEHFKRNGKPKRRFESAGEANTFLQRSKQTRVFKPYRCDFCWGYHVAHRNSPAWQKSARLHRL